MSNNKNKLPYPFMNFIFLRYPVPTAFGLPGMRAVIQATTHAPPEPYTLYLAHSENRKVLIGAVFDKDGLASVEKTYCLDGTFDIAAAMKGHRHRKPIVLSATEYDAIFKMRIVKDLLKKTKKP